jgi:NAD(P)-dependent dehydrogenase (short-subunit alcohol dehydrogenase family)
MIVSMTEDDWDAVMRVHLKGLFCPVRHAVQHWRERVKAGHEVDARIVTTSSGAGLYGSIGQANYAAAKAGIAAFTLVAAAELARYGITTNAIAPAARSRMTEAAFPEMMAAPASGFDAMNADNIAPLVAWLGSLESKDVTGRVFEVQGGEISVASGWGKGPAMDKGERWDPAELGPVVRELLAMAAVSVPVFGVQ